MIVDEASWLNRAKKSLLGRKIVDVQWMSSQEAERVGWLGRPVILILDDGTWISPMRDDEGNDGGALAQGEETWPVLPVVDDPASSE